MPPKKDKFRVGFFIVGQPKSGTTALAKFLSQHPDIGMSEPKEPGYFDTDFRRESDKFHNRALYSRIRTFKDYKSVFKNSDTKRIIGEASTSYLYSKEAARNIYKHNPRAKIIIMLRNPADFLHSLHMQFVNEAHENEKDFKKALAKETERKQGNNIPKWVPYPSELYYLDRARYYEQVKRYFDIFPERQILVIITEEFQTDNAGYFKQVLRFLGVDQNFVPKFGTVHGSKTPRFHSLNRVLNNPSLKKRLFDIVGLDAYMSVRSKVAKIMMKPQQRTSLDNKLREKIAGDVSSDINKLSKLLGQNLLNVWGMDS